MPYGSPHIRSCLCSIPFQHVIVAVDLFGILRIAPGIRMRSLHKTAAFCLQLLLGERNLQSKELQCCVIIAGSLSGITSCSAVIGITAFVFSIFSMCYSFPYDMYFRFPGCCSPVRKSRFLYHHQRIPHSFSDTQKLRP